MLAKHFQEGDWNKALRYAQELNVNENSLQEIYMEAIGLADALFEIPN